MSAHPVKPKKCLPVQEGLDPMPQSMNIHAHIITSAFAEIPPDEHDTAFFQMVSTSMYVFVGIHPSDLSIIEYDRKYTLMAKFQPFQFASLELTSEDEKPFMEWYSKDDVNLHTCLTSLLEAGFKLSASWVVDQNSFCFTVIGTDVTRDHKNMCMTSWSDDLEEVVAIGCYKHFVICNGQEWPTRGTGKRWG